MIDPSRGERDADVSLVDIKARRFVGKELIRERVVEQRGQTRRGAVGHEAVLVEVKFGNLSTMAAGRPTKKTAPGAAHGRHLRLVAAIHAAEMPRAPANNEDDA